LTNQATCLDGLEEANVNLPLLSFTTHIFNASRSASVCLALVNKFWMGGVDSQQTTTVHNRRLFSGGRQPRRNGDDFLSQYGPVDDGFPSWLSRADRRRLLQTASGVDLTENGVLVTVSKDGSGNYTTITDAINAAQDKSGDRY
ncbi:hypothetical protein KI387_009926, partial [Taxus chinensis]